MQRPASLHLLSGSKVSILPLPNFTRRARACSVSASSCADKLASRCENPVARAVIKEPSVFCFGVVAGLLGLDVTEPPLSDWLKRTATVTQESETVSVTIIEPQPSTYGASAFQGTPERL